MIKAFVFAGVSVFVLASFHPALADESTDDGAAAELEDLTDRHVRRADLAPGELLEDVGVERVALTHEPEPPHVDVLADPDRRAAMSAAAVERAGTRIWQALAPVRRPGRAGAARPAPRTKRSPKPCWPIPRNAPST